MSVKEDYASKEKQEELMAETWSKMKAGLYASGLDKIDQTAQSLVTLSAGLVTVGFTVVGTLVSAKILVASPLSLALSFFGFFFFMLCTISSVLVFFRRQFNVSQLSQPPEISAEWDAIRAVKYDWLKRAYLFFIVGVVIEILGILSLIV